MTLARAGLLLVLLLAALVAPAHAHGPDDGEHSTLDTDGDGLPDILASATFDQRLGEQVPLDLTFVDEAGQTVRLDDLFHEGKPVILTMNYYHCETLCPLLLDGLVRGLHGVSFTIGEQFNVVTVSVDPSDSPETARAIKQRYVERYRRSDVGDHWSFLTGTHEQIDALAEVVGVNYAYDEAAGEYAHPSGAIILTPDGQIARYIYGLEFSPRDLRLALVEASEGRIGNPVDQVLLFCYRYDPAAGQYTPLVLNIMRLGGGLTLVALVLFVGPLFFREFRQNRLTVTGAAK